VRGSTQMLAAAFAGTMLVGCGSSDQQGAPAAAKAEGDPFSLVAMAHTFADSSKAWDGTGAEGTFNYVSAPCNFDAPVNNNSTNLGTFNGRLPGSTSPSSARMHPVEFAVTEADGGSGVLDGTMSMTVCQTKPGATAEDDPVPDTDKDDITFTWTADYSQSSAEEIPFTGTFEIDGGTGTYDGITGSGEVAGYFTCAWGNPDGCAKAGEFTDLQLVMIGRYDAPGAQG
jgi:hypothetical protein